MQKEDFATPKEKISQVGFVIIQDVFNHTETELLQNVIGTVSGQNPSFRKTDDLFAIRRFLQEVPGSGKYIFTDKFNDIIASLLGKDYFPVKSIYFDKPGSSNWFVSYHQDLTISVDRKAVIPGYGPWTVKQDQFAVQPPVDLLNNIFTIRIHLDDTDENNGALRVIPGSHLKGIYRPETIDWNREKEVVCAVPAGGIMIMKPLLLHASSRTVNQSRRRVIHIEFCNQELPASLRWAERTTVL